VLDHRDAGGEQDRMGRTVSSRKPCACRPPPLLKVTSASKDARYSVTGTSSPIPVDRRTLTSAAGVEDPEQWWVWFGQIL
jgi:hypothetical protein